jgi:hypothetical protein
MVYNGQSIYKWMSWGYPHGLEISIYYQILPVHTRPLLTINPYNPNTIPRPYHLPHRFSKTTRDLSRPSANGIARHARSPSPVELLCETPRNIRVF